MKHPILVTLVTCAMCVVSTSGYSADVIGLGKRPEVTHDGRFNTRCYAWNHVPAYSELCQVSFFNLLATPERYHGRMIAVTGYLVEGNRLPVLYPDAQRYKIAAESEGLVIFGQISAELQELLPKGVQPVTAVGVFNANFEGAGFPVLGALQNLQVLERVDFFEPPKPQ